MILLTVRSPGNTDKPLHPSEPDCTGLSAHSARRASAPCKRTRLRPDPQQSVGPWRSAETKSLEPSPKTTRRVLVLERTTFSERANCEADLELGYTNDWS